MPRGAGDEDARRVDDRRAAGARLSRPHRPAARRERSRYLLRAAAAPRCRKAIRWPTRSSWRSPTSTARPQDARIFLAAPIGLDEIEEPFAEQIVDEEALQWNEREGVVLARRRRRLGALLLEDKPLAKPDADKLKAAMIEGIRQLGLGALPWIGRLAQWRERVAFLRTPGRRLARPVGRGAARRRSTTGSRPSSTA